MPRRFALFALIIAAAAAQDASERAAWNRPFKPFRIIGDIYYVGVEGISAFLITTPEGNILLDGGLPETAPLIEKSLAALKFSVRDTRLLLNSHAHFDHSGGLAELKRRSGARLIASRADSQALITGRQIASGPGRESTSPPVKVDQVIGDHETVRLGGVTLTAHLTPGHTPGCTTWTMPVTEAGKSYNVVFYCSTTIAGNRLVHNPNYPNIVADYRRSFAALRKLPCDVFLGPHPSFFHLEEKRKAMSGGGPNPFIDSNEMRKFVDLSERDFEAGLKQRQARAHP